MDYAQGALSYVMGPGLVPQVLLVVVIMVVANVVISVFEVIVNTVKKMDQQTAVLQSDTVTDKMTILQKPNGDDPLIYSSANEPSGLEFSYSMWIFIDPKTFENSRTQQCGPAGTVNSAAMKHIFHKGSKSGFPLLGPAVFVMGNTNTLRVYQNTSTAWNSFVEVPNIPVGKWFHLVITMKGKFMDVFVNGNIAVREEFATVPKLNFGNVYLLSPITFPPNPNTPLQLGDYKVDGAAVGMVSRVKYFAYAANYAQIDTLFREGPSKKIVSKTYTQTPPYMFDDWWVTRY
jgi:hypothetical protein